MERDLEVATGESVAFSYELAGLGSRFFALFIDLAIQIAIVIFALVILAWIVTALPDVGKTSRIDKIGTGILSGIAYAATFLVFFGYFIFFEWRFNGRTPGKRVLGIRVVRDGGIPIDFTASLVRNVVRVLESGLGFYAISAIVALASTRNQRLGDMVAGTLVVRDSRYERTAATLVAGERDDVLVRELAPAERDLIRRYYERRPGLGQEARDNVAAQIAARVRPKLAASFEHLSNDDLLVHLATTAL